MRAGDGASTATDIYIADVNATVLAGAAGVYGSAAATSAAATAQAQRLLAIQSTLVSAAAAGTLGGALGVPLQSMSVQDLPVVPVATPPPAVVASTRDIIDIFNLTFALLSDETNVSAGAADVFADGLGCGRARASSGVGCRIQVMLPSPLLPRRSARATAVMFQTARGNGLPFTPARVDLLLAKTADQARSLLTDFYVTLFADDGSAAHYPGAQVGAGRSGAGVSRVHAEGGESVEALCS